MSQQDDRCESGCDAPVVQHDIDGVPLCAACWLALCNDNAARTAIDAPPMEHPGLYFRAKSAYEQAMLDDGTLPEDKYAWCVQPVSIQQRWIRVVRAALRNPHNQRGA